MTHGTYDLLYVAFIAYFNRERDYFECHEVMEQLWLEQGRDPLYQGLLQVAVGLYHHRNNNIDGGVKLLTAAIQKLEGQGDIVLGIDLAKLLVDAKHHLDRLKQHEVEPFPFQDIDIMIVDEELARLSDSFTPGDEGHEED